jgi:hypothetical protein
MESETEFACDPVERGAVRRYAQAIMDEDPAYADVCEGNARYGGPVAPPLYPTQMFRRAFGTPDPIQEHAHDLEFDGVGPNISQGLPRPAPLEKMAMLNGGADIELYRYARHGERVSRKSRYADIVEKQTAKGTMVFVTMETEYRGGDGGLIACVRRTLIWR